MNLDKYSQQAHILTMSASCVKYFEKVISKYCQGRFNGEETVKKLQALDLANF